MRPPPWEKLRKREEKRKKGRKRRGNGTKVVGGGSSGWPNRKMKHPVAVPEGLKNLLFQIEMEKSLKSKSNKSHNT